MPVAPYVVPARPQTVYDQVRVSALSITQSAAGAPLVVSYQIDRYRDRPDGTPEDAPNGGGRVSGSVQIGVPALFADAATAQAVAAITARAVAEAVAAGLLTELPH